MELHKKLTQPATVFSLNYACISPFKEIMDEKEKDLIEGY